MTDERPCELCGLPMTESRKTYHPECQRALKTLKQKMRRRYPDLDHTEIEWRWGELQAGIRQLFETNSSEVTREIGEKGVDALVAFERYLKGNAGE